MNGVGRGQIGKKMPQWQADLSVWRVAYTPNSRGDPCFPPINGFHSCYRAYPFHTDTQFEDEAVLT